MRPFIPICLMVGALAFCLVAGIGVGRSTGRPVAPEPFPPAQELLGATSLSVAEAVRLHEAALNAFIEAGLSGDVQAMHFIPMSHDECVKRAERLRKNADHDTPEFREFWANILVSLENWQLLMQGAIGRSGYLRGTGDLEGEARILDSITNIALANAADGRPVIGRTSAEFLLEMIENEKRKREKFDP